MDSSINWADKTCNETIWLTPEKLLIPVRNYFKGSIPLDPATEASNPTEATKFYTKEDNGLALPWNEPVFVNPPYGKEIQLWCRKIYEESTRKPKRPIIALLPCGSGRPGTKYWQSCILQDRLNMICYVRGRVNFLRSDGVVAKGNTYPSQILGFNIKWVTRFYNCFSPLGKVLKIAVLN